MKSLASCAALLCLWASVTAQDDIKNIFSRINNEIIKGTYSARVEVTRLWKDDANKTYSIVEYHDSKAGVHSIEMTPLNIRKFFYQNLEKGTIVTVDADRNCTTKSVEAAAKETEAFIYRSDHALTPEYFLGPTSVIVDMSTDTFNWTAAPDEVRGIKANLYSSTQRNDGSTRSVDVWFAQDFWDIKKMSAKKVPFPLRVRIEEKGIIDQFDFYQVEDLSPTEAFRLGDHVQLPFRTVGCQLPKPDRKPASLQTTFSFTSVVNGIIAAKEYFSIDDQLYRADTEGSTDIHDDKHGLIYKLRSGCSVEPNPLVNRAVVSTGSWNFGAQVVQAYLSLPEKFLIGEGFVRGIPVDIWDAAPALEDPNVQRARFFFSKPLAVQSANGDTGTTQLVKAMLLNSFDHSDILDVDIYDFASTIGDLDFRQNFNIEDCVEASMYVEFGLQADSSFNVEEFKLSNAQNELIESLEDNIEGSTGVSFLQLPTFKAEVVDEKNIKVIVKILAPPPYLKSFTVRNETVAHYEGSPRDSPNAEDCAKECILNKKCPTFLFCGKSTCQLQKSSKTTEWGKAISNSDINCYVYDHVPTVDTMERRTLEDISSDLEKSVMWLWSPFNVSTSDNKYVTLRAISFSDHLTQFNKQGTLGPYMSQYTSMSILDDHESSVVVAGEVPTVGQCYRECRNNKDIACSSFSICTGAKHCVLTSENINSGTFNDIDQDKTIKTATKDCSIYSVNYLSEFDRLDGKSRKSGSIEHSTGETAGDCAVRCRQQKLELLEDCKSFNFCSKKKRCFFYRTHYNWDGGDDALTDDGDCDHYALRYSASYTAIGKGAFIGKPATEVKDVSFEECAKQCSERSNGKCKTISYCDSNIPNKAKETCYMYSGDIVDLSDANNKESTCTIYTELVSLNDDLINPKRQLDAERKSVQLGMGDGALAGLLIAMVAIGAVLGVAGWFQREKITALVGRSGSPPPTENTISYHRQEDENRAEA